MDRGAVRLQSIGSLGVGHDWATSLLLSLIYGIVLPHAALKNCCFIPITFSPGTHLGENRQVGRATDVKNRPVKWDKPRKNLFLHRSEDASESLLCTQPFPVLLLPSMEVRQFHYTTMICAFTCLEGSLSDWLLLHKVVGLESVLCPKIAFNFLHLENLCYIILTVIIFHAII